MTSFLLLTAIVIFACVFLNRVSDKLGMFFGSDGPINIAFENYSSLHDDLLPAWTSLHAIEAP